MLVGKTDVFERLYAQKFRLLVGEFGEFVEYERDRGARDIGLHLTRRDSTGSETVTSTLCWFQLKGIRSTTLPRHAFNERQAIRLRVKVSHLKFWYLQPMPTYLVVYIECADLFLVLNIQKYVEDKWGTSILTLPQGNATIIIPKDSVLDKQAFFLILRKGDVNQWVKVVGATPEQAIVCMRDYELIYHIGTAGQRGFEQRLVFRKWNTKLRSELRFQERKVGSSDTWETIREHWESVPPEVDLEETFPYLDFFSLYPEDGPDAWWIVDDDDYDDYPFETRPVLRSGEIIHGRPFASEFVEYYLGFSLNNMGLQMSRWITEMTKAGLLEKAKIKKSSFTSVDYWSHREV
jgi:hypothetical protein